MKVIKTDVVIVGSGGAGLRCALELRENDQTDILIVGDRKFTDAHTTWARGGINAALGTLDPKDTTLIHAVDTYREAVEVADPDLVEELADNAPSAIEDLVRWGANFHKEADGRTLTQRFFGAHSYRRTCFSGDETGLEMIRTLTRRSYELQIPYLEFLYVYDLIVQDGKVQGIRGMKDNEEYCILAPVVVFATGGYPNVYWRSSSRNKENFGEGIWMALQAGTTIGDLELIQFHPTGLMFPESHAGELVTEAVRGEGGILKNAQGERFMEKYDPLKLELSTRDVVARANFREIIEGRGTKRGAVYLDISHREEEYIKERLPKMYSMIKEFNDVDITKDSVEVAPTTHYTMGGIKFDSVSMQTDIEGFYVAGECTMGVHGANRLGGNSLMETMVFGKKVAQAILGSKQGTVSYIPDESQDALERVHVSSNGVCGYETLEDIRKHVRRLAGILRTESELIELQNYLLKKKSEIDSVGIKVTGTPQEKLVDARRLQVVVDLALLITQGAIQRKESRGAHFRSDFPEIDSTFSKNYLHRKQSDGSIKSFWIDSKKPSSRLADAMENTERTKNYGHSE